MMLCRKGFTLIEILTVIAIIALLLMLLLPVLWSVQEEGRSRRCLSNLSQLGKAFLLYLQDYGEAFPLAYDLNAPETGIGWVVRDSREIYAPERGAIYPYVRDPAVYVCPSDAVGRRRRLSYSMNAYLGYIDGRIIRYYSEIEVPSALILLSEFSHMRAFNTSVFDSRCGGLLDTPYPCPKDPIPCGESFCLEELACYHNGGTNALFCDGHVKGFPRGTLKCRYTYPSSE